MLSLVQIFDLWRKPNTSLVGKASYVFLVSFIGHLICAFFKIYLWLFGFMAFKKVIMEQVNIETYYMIYSRSFYW